MGKELAGREIQGISQLMFSQNYKDYDSVYMRSLAYHDYTSILSADFEKIGTAA